MIKLLLTTLAPNIDLKLIETHHPPVSVIHSADVKSINRAKYSPLPRVKCRPGAWWAPWRHRWGRELKQSASQPPVLRPTPPHLARARWTDAKQELRNCVSVAVTHATARGLSPPVDTTSPGERQEKKPGIPIICVPRLRRPCLLRSSARRGGGLERTTTGTAYLGTRRPSSLSCVRISSREAARWRATWINNSILTRTTAEGPRLLWKLHLQVSPDIYGIKVPVRVISKSLIRFGFHICQ